MVRQSLIFSIAIVVLSAGFLFFGNLGVFAPESVSAEEESSSDESSDESTVYSELPVNAGVWDEGQAALWDLHLIDHFRYFGASERARGYKPEQPINFSHITHVQKNQMECQYCHWSVTKSSYAAIPEVETCMGCHRYVGGRTEEQQGEIEKIKEYWSNGEAIPWEKVHAMPNYLKFNHKRHVKAGVSCHSCHGQIQNMEVVERVSSMKMGWCISCHREQGSSIDCATCHY